MTILKLYAACLQDVRLGIEFVPELLIVHLEQLRLGNGSVEESDMIPLMSSFWRKDLLLDDKGAVEGNA